MVNNIPYTVSGVKGDIGILYTIAGVRSMISVENDTCYARYNIRHVINHCWRERYRVILNYWHDFGAQPSLDE